jgi:hypothetical protein
MTQFPYVDAHVAAAGRGRGEQPDIVRRTPLRVYALGRHLRLFTHQSASEPDI